MEFRTDFENFRPKARKSSVHNVHTKMEDIVNKTQNDKNTQNNKIIIKVFLSMTVGHDYHTNIYLLNILLFPKLVLTKVSLRSISTLFPMPPTHAEKHMRSKIH